MEIEWTWIFRSVGALSNIRIPADDYRAGPSLTSYGCDPVHPETSILCDANRKCFDASIAQAASETRFASHSMLVAGRGRAGSQRWRSAYGCDPVHPETSILCDANRKCIDAGLGNACVPRGVDEKPEYEQNVSLATTLFQAMASHLHVATTVADQAAAQVYAMGSSQNARIKAIDAASRVLRIALLVESIAQTMETNLETTNPTAPWKGRYSAALQEFTAARNDLLAKVVALSNGGNPLGIRDNDVPLFFGDPTGTNSRYFASSDYLINGWAAPAVTTAQASLGAARDAWIAAENSQVQEADAQANRQHYVDQLLGTYGQKILDSGPDRNQKPGAGEHERRSRDSGSAGTIPTDLPGDLLHQQRRSHVCRC